MRYLALLTLPVLLTHGAEWYVSPSGSGAGTYGDPMSFATALTSASVVGGDTVWMLRGTYSGTFTGSRSGLSGQPIVYRNHPSGQAVIDGPIAFGNRTNVWLWGVEVIDSLKATRTAPFTAVSMQPEGNAVINCLIHDCCMGIGPHGPEIIYGNVLWNCGHNDSLEHGLYLQNETTHPTKIVENNIIGTSSGFGIQAYGSSGGMASMHFINNAIWLSGKYDILFGGGKPITDGQVIGNHTAYGGTGGLKLGYSIANTDVVVANNMFCGKTSFEYLFQFDSITFTNNLLYTPYWYCENAEDVESITGVVAWDYNSLFKANMGSGRNWFNKLGSTSYLGDEWKAASGVDLNSTFLAGGTPSVNSVHVYTNLYKPKSGHVVVWNWEGLDNVAADVSSVLAVGDYYAVKTGLNYPLGVIKSGVYSGGTITLPMTNLTQAPFLYWTNGNLAQSVNISGDFNAFIIEGNAVGVQTRRHAMTTTGL